LLLKKKTEKRERRNEGKKKKIYYNYNSKIPKTTSVAIHGISRDTRNQNTHEKKAPIYFGTQCFLTHTAHSEGR
jgi:hypothetical protein